MLVLMPTNKATHRNTIQIKGETIPNTLAAVCVTMPWPASTQRSSVCSPLRAKRTRLTARWAAHSTRSQRARCPDIISQGLSGTTVAEFPWTEQVSPLQVGTSSLVRSQNHTENALPARAQRWRQLRHPPETCRSAPAHAVPASRSRPGQRSRMSAPLTCRHRTGCGSNLPSAARPCACCPLGPFLHMLLRLHGAVGTSQHRRTQVPLAWGFASQ